MDRADGPTRASVLRQAARHLADAGLPEVPADARRLVCAALAIDRLALLRDPDAPVDAAALARLDALVTRRLAREPVSRILGRRAFWGLDLVVTPAVLDPRPDTETLVEAVLDRLRALRERPLRVLDLGTGSGAILCALLTELPRARGWAVDRSVAACAVARLNLDACGAGESALVVCGSWGDALADGAFDVLVSNPPYIQTAAIATLESDVREHDPREALDGGADGLDAYRALAEWIPGLLAPGGFAALEVGAGQAAAVADLLRAAGLRDLTTRCDLAGIERVVTASR